MKEKKTFQEYWKNSWNLFTLLYLFFSIILTTILIICIIYAAKKPVIDSISFGAIFLFSVNMVVLLFKWGFAKGIISGAKAAHAEKVARKRAKARYGKNSSINEQTRIIIEEREKYAKEQEKKQDLANKLKKTTNLVFYILVVISLLTIIVLIPYMIR